MKLEDKIEDLEAALEKFQLTEDGAEYELPVFQTAHAMRSLLRAIEQGRWAIVPCEAGDRLGEEFLQALFDKSMGTPFTLCFNAAIKAAPTEEIMKELFGEKT